MMIFGEMMPLKTHFLRMLILASALLPCAAIAQEGGATARGPECAQILLKDQDKLPVKTDQPIIGMIVGNRPILPPSIMPPFTTMSVGLPAACPESLVRSVQSIYDDSCTTEQRRKQTAKDNKTTEDEVNRNCRNITAALKGLPPPDAKPPAR